MLAEFPFMSSFFIINITGQVATLNLKFVKLQNTYLPKLLRVVQWKSIYKIFTSFVEKN